MTSRGGGLLPGAVVLHGRNASPPTMATLWAVWPGSEIVKKNIIDKYTGVLPIQYFKSEEK